MQDHWRPDGRGGGYTVPNRDVYPHQWLWDSCFHSIIWAELGEPERAVAELSAALADQADDGFVPHVRYVADPYGLSGFWGRPHTSSITQPPMYRRAVAELRRRGVAVPAEVVARAGAGVRFLLDVRARTDDGLVTVVHPWETGCDDSPRWDSWCDDDWNANRWFEVKGELLATVERSACGSPIANPAFAVRPLASTPWSRSTPGSSGWSTNAARWPARSRPAGRPICGRGSMGTTPRAGSGRSARCCRSSSVVAHETVLADLVDHDAFGGRYGPPAVHRDEPVFDPEGYWRGSAWPQLTYLLTHAGCRWVGTSSTGRRRPASPSTGTPTRRRAWAPPRSPGPGWPCSLRPRPAG